LGLGKLLQQD